MAERASMPTFVPRTVASFERTATAVARRVAAPVRMLATRALSFADRLVGSWTGGTPTVGGFESGARPAMLASTRGAGMPLPRPWYEVDHDEDTIWPQQAAIAAAAAQSARAAAAAATLPSAERGAAIARTTLTGPDAPSARAVTPSAQSPVEATTVTAREAQQIVAAATADVRVAEALGLRAPIAAPAPSVAPVVARATTPLGRALAHAAWVDTQLRVTAPAARAATTSPGYVFIAPADVERPMAPGAAAAIGTESLSQPSSQPARPAAAQALAAPSVAAWSPLLPDPRLPVTMPTPIAQRVADFVARLVGVQTARDATPVTPAAPPSVPVIARGATAERTFVEIVAPAPVSTAVSWRPGAAGARVEQLGASVDARVSAAWGEPHQAAAARRMAPVETILPTPAAEVAAAPAAGTAASATARSLPAIERTLVAPSEPAPRATGPARLAQFVQQLVGVQAARATAPLPVQALVAAIARAAEAATATPGPATASSERAPERVALTATMSAPPAAMAAPRVTAPTSAAPAAAVMTPPATMPAFATAAAPGAVGRRAEQLGGVVGVRAASLSIDFVDPARLSMLTAAAPSMPTVAPAAEAAARDTIMPAPRPLFLAEPTAAPASSALTSEEWSLVATFPSAATAMQLASARQSAQWSERSAPAAEAPLRTLLSGIAPTTTARADERIAAEPGRATAAIAARGGAPAVFVAPTVAAAETEGRLPGGRTPRGSFIWPKLAESPVRAEWTASATVAAAERAQQAVPGTPLWGSLPPLIAVAPSLAAQAQVAATSAEAGGRAASPTGVPRGESLTPSLTAASLTHEMVRGDVGGAAGAGASDVMAAEVAAGRAAAMRNDAPAMTLMTAAATREARAAARMGARSDDAEGDFEPGRAAAPGLPLTSASGEPMRAGGAAGVSNVRPAAAMPLMTASPTARDGAAATGAPAGPAARALELARPFLRLVESGIGSDGGQRAAGPRFFEQPQPLVAGAPSSDSASRIVEALRSQPSASSGDDRVSLADLTLIAIASATQQVAASPAGGGPSAGGAAAAAPSAAPEGGGGHGGGAKSGNPAQEIEELARAAFDELQRLMAIARERSGDHG